MRQATSTSRCTFASALPCTPSTSGRSSEYLLGSTAALPLPSPASSRRQRAATLSIRASASSPRKDMSTQQRMRALKFAIDERKKQFAASPPIAAVLSAVGAVRAALQPLVDLMEVLSKRWEAMNEAYNQFLAEETKAKWTWSKRNRKELDLLASIPPYIFALLCTLLYQTFVPVSVLCALVLPLYYAWVVWDRWWLSPVFLGVVIMTPMKFVPWAVGVFCWVWPGII